MCILPLTRNIRHEHEIDLLSMLLLISKSMIQIFPCCSLAADTVSDTEGHHSFVCCTRTNSCTASVSLHSQLGNGWLALIVACFWASAGRFRLSTVWGSSHCSLARWHTLYLGRAAAGHHSLPFKSISAIQERLNCRWNACT